MDWIELATEMALRAKRLQAELNTLTALTGKTVEELDSDWTAPDEMPWLTVSKAAELYDITGPALRAALRRGKIRGEKQGGTWVVNVESLLEYIAAHQGEKRGWPAGVSRCRLCGGMDIEGHTCLGTKKGK